MSHPPRRRSRLDAGAPRGPAPPAALQLGAPGRARIALRRLPRERAFDAGKAGLPGRLESAAAQFGGAELRRGELRLIKFPRRLWDAGVVLRD